MSLVAKGFSILGSILTLFPSLTEKALDLFYWIFYGKRKLLPVIDNEILLMTATELAEKIRKKEISAENVMQVYISRIKAVQPIINACVGERFEEAIADAKSVDEMLETGIKTEEELAEAFPLLGVPFTCKEIIGVKDLAQTWASVRFSKRKAPEDGESTAQYRKAGAIPVVVTNIPTLGIWWDTSNAVFGATKNPYNDYRTPGGSSGGEAALISAAGAVIGIGNDLAGSIRIPASFCGIYGHKPSPGLVSNKTTWPEMHNVSEIIKNVDPFLSTGPMCRYAEDLPLLLRVLSDNKCKKLHEKVNFKKIDIYYMEEFPGYPASPDVKNAVKRAVAHFEKEYGITAKGIEIEELKYALDIWESKLFEAGASFRSAMPEKNGTIMEFWELFKWLFGFSEFDFRVLYHACVEFQNKNSYYEQCLEMYKAIEQKLEILDENAILILPTHPEPPPHPVVTIPKFYNIGYTCIFNILQLPITAVPAGRSSGLPIGLQVVAEKNNDHLTLAAANELSKVFGGWSSPCSISV